MGHARLGTGDPSQARCETRRWQRTVGLSGMPVGVGVSVDFPLVEKVPGGRDDAES